MARSRNLRTGFVRINAVKATSFLLSSLALTRRSMLFMGAIAAALFVISCTTGKGNFLLINEAKEPIVHALVAISGQMIELRDIQPGKSAEGHYDVKSDSHFTIEVEFQSGRKLRKETGYVTNGMDFQHQIIVTDTDIKIADSMN